MKLTELQRNFSTSIIDKNIPMDSSLVDSSAMVIYQDNYRIVLTSTLALVYPAVLALVGQDFFDAVADHYIKSHPPTSTNLEYYGEQFSIFLAQHAACQNYPYFTDVAQVEWLKHESNLANDAPALTLTDLQNISHVKLDSLPLALHPSVRLMHSDYDLKAIFEMIKNPEGDGVIDWRNKDSCYCVIFRSSYTPNVEWITEEDYRFLLSVQEGQATSTFGLAEFTRLFQRWILLVTCH